VSPASRAPHPAPRVSGGFTLLEVLVAITVATLLFGICIAIYVSVSRYKSRSEGLLFLHETARGVFARMGRDLGGLHVADSDRDGDTDATDYWEPAAGRLTFLTATENPGKLDYCTVGYYLEGGRLYRELSDAKGGSAPTGGWPSKADSVVAEGVQEFTVSTVPAAPAAGRLPASVTVTLKMSDPGGQPAYRLFTATFRLGAEEN